MGDHRDMVNELCDCTQGMSSWECDFISDMYDRSDEYTERQKAKIEQIWEKVFK